MYNIYIKQRKNFSSNSRRNGEAAFPWYYWHWRGCCAVCICLDIE